MPLAKAALRCLLVLHALAAAAWWWAMPHGFPFLHPRTLANTIAPGLVLGLGLAFRSPRAAGATLAGVWLGAAIGLFLAFPTSGPRAAPWLALPAAAVVASTWRAGRRRPRAAHCLVAPLPGQPRLTSSRGGPQPTSARLRARAPRQAGCPSAPLVLAGAALGLALPFTQRAPAPDTRPLLPAGSSLPAPFEGWPATEGAGPAFELRAAAESVGLDLGGGVRVDVEPLLTFTSRSPDGCWTLLSTPAARRGPPRGVERVSARFADYASADGPAALRARARPGALEVEGLVALGEPVFAHLACASFVSITGLAAPSVRFDACPGVEVALRESDYPVGRPARFACFDGARLRVLEATSGEKGPFQPLAEGPLARGEPLGLTLIDRGRPVVHLTWLDFTAQAGLGRSPTAGWGAPVNALELHLAASPRGSTVRLYAELAATSIGRGFDSVGHTAGVYRERLVVRPLGRE